MRSLLILFILTSLVTIELNTLNFNYSFAYSQQLQQQTLSENNSNASKTFNTINSNINSSKLNTNDDLANYLGYQYEYNFY